MHVITIWLSFPYAGGASPEDAMKSNLVLYRCGRAFTGGSDFGISVGFSSARKNQIAIRHLSYFFSEQR